MRPRKGLVHGENFPTKPTENFLETVRAEFYSEKRSRLKCVFASAESDPLNLSAVGALMTNILECETEEPESSNVGWYSVIRRSIANIPLGRILDEKLLKWVHHYWDGEPLDRRTVNEDLSEIGVDLGIIGFLPDSWEARCDKLVVTDAHSSAKGHLDHYSVQSWGHKNDRVTISTDYHDDEVPILNRIGQININDGIISVISPLSIGTSAYMLSVLKQDGSLAPTERSLKWGL